MHKLLILALLLMSQPLSARQREPIENIEEVYKKLLTNSTWIVPPETLLAYEYINGTNLPVSDQTVWVITGFDKGYFFGDSYTALDVSALSQKKLVGSITPKGDVYITFFSSNTSSTDVVKGTGTFAKLNGSYTFTMQMNSADSNTSGLSHWSYMISVTPGDYYYQHLPSLDISVPDFISQF